MSKNIAVTMGGFTDFSGVEVSNTQRGRVSVVGRNKLAQTTSSHMRGYHRVLTATLPCGWGGLFDEFPQRRRSWKCRSKHAISNSESCE